MFVNEYVMTRKRYDKWAVPKFLEASHLLRILCNLCSRNFRLDLFSSCRRFAQMAVCWCYAFLYSLYRGVFFKWMHADKTFRVTRTQYFNDKDWTCKVMIREKDIALFINNKINNHVNWEDLTKFEEAKTYYKLTSKDQIEGVMLDKDSFTEGDSSSFKQWMLEQHPEIEYGPIDPAFDK